VQPCSWNLFRLHRRALSSSLQDLPQACAAERDLYRSACGRSGIYSTPLEFPALDGAVLRRIRCTLAGGSMQLHGPGLGWHLRTHPHAHPRQLPAHGGTCLQLRCLFCTTVAWLLCECPLTCCKMLSRSLDPGLAPYVLRKYALLTRRIHLRGLAPDCRETQELGCRVHQLGSGRRSSTRGNR